MNRPTAKKADLDRAVFTPDGVPLGATIGPSGRPVLAEQPLPRFGTLGLWVGALLLFVYPVLGAVILVLWGLSWLGKRGSLEVLSIAACNEGIRAHNRGDFDQALLHLKEALRHNPRNPRSLEVMVSIYHDVKHDREATKEYLTRLLEVEPDNFVAQLGQAHWHFENGDCGQAIELLRRVQLPPIPYLEAQRAILLGRCLFEQGRYGEAVEELERGPVHRQVTDPYTMAVNYWLGLSYLRLGDEAKARELLARVHRMDPGYEDLPAIDGELGLGLSVSPEDENWSAKPSRPSQTFEPPPHTVPAPPAPTPEAEWPLPGLPAKEVVRAFCDLWDRRGGPPPVKKRSWQFRYPGWTKSVVLIYDSQDNDRVELYLSYLADRFPAEVASALSLVLATVPKAHTTLTPFNVVVPHVGVHLGKAELRTLLEIVESFWPGSAQGSSCGWPIPPGPGRAGPGERGPAVHG
jgi:tetratricopeptide (TPR) repeat protein